MSKLSYKTLLIIFCFLLIGVIVLAKFVLPKNIIKANWWNDGWHYRQAIPVTNTLGSTINNQIVKITIDTNALVTAGKLQSDCDDIRITDINGNLLDHWDTNCNTTTTNIYFKLSSIPTSDTTTYFYYGNVSANNSEKNLGTTENPGTSCQMMKDQGSVTTNGTYYIVPGGNSADKQFVYCDQTTDGGGWTLIMNQKSNTGGFFANSTQAQNYNESNPTADRYSILGKLAKFKDNGIFTFKINWPSLGSTRNIWSQTSNPISENIAGYTGITVDQTTNSWGGIALSSSSTTFIDGSPGVGTWYYAIASYASYNGGIPPFTEPATNQTQLWVKGNNTMNNVSVGILQSEEAGGGPIAYWKFDEGVGTTAYDSTSNQNNGVFGLGTSIPTWQTESQCINGKCLYFDGGKNYVDFGNSSTLKVEQGNFTVETWFKSTISKCGAEIVDKGKNLMCGSSTYGGWSLGQRAGKTIFITSDSNTDNYAEVLENVSRVNQWVHAVGVKNGDTISLYINGKFITSTTKSGIAIDTDATVRVGGHTTAAWNAQAFIDDVKIYPYARTADQIKLDYNSHGSPSGSSANLGIKSNTGPSLSSKLIADWKFDEGNGSTVYDSSGNNLNGSFFGAGSSGPSWTNNAKNNKALSFGGDIQSIFVPNSSSIGLTNNFTISTWVYPREYPSAGVFKVLMGKVNTWTNGYALGSNNGNFQFLVTNGVGYTIVSDTSNYSLNKWYFLTATYNNSILRFYVNGILKDQQTVPTIVSSSNDFYIGGANGASNRGFNSIIDEVKIYNSALTDEEVKQDYNQSSAIQFGSTTQNIGGTTTSLEYCIPGDTSFCAPPIAEWNFEENTGTVAKDTSSNNNNGTFGTGSSAPIWDLGQKNKGSGIKLDGVNDIVDASNIKPTNITASMWIYPTSFSNQTFISLLSERSSYSDGFMFFTSNGGSLTFDWGGSGYRWGTDYQPPLNQWTFLTISRDTNGRYLYVNGQLKVGTTNPGIDITTSSNLHIGWDSFGGGFNFQGKIDDVKIYNYARTPAQIAYDYNKGTPVGWWKFDECQGSIAHDSSGLGNNGTISIGQSGTQNSLGTCQTETSAAWTTGASGHTNSSLNFDGVDDYMTAPISVGGSEATVSFWVKNPAAGIGTYLFRSNANVRTYIIINGNTIGFTKGNPAKGITGGTINTSIWNHIVLKWWTDSNNITYAKSYINSNPTSSNIGTSFLDTSQGSYISVAAFANTGNSNASGQFDDVRVYNYALTDTQIKTLYNGGSVSFN